MKNLLKMEPTLLIGLLRALLLAAVAFGLPLTSAQEAALLAVAGAGLALAGVNRAVVTPVSKVEELGEEIGGNATKLVDRLLGGKQ